MLIGLVAIGVIVGGIFWMGNRDGAANGAPELIAAPEGDYKVKPDDPGGMTVEGQGETAFDAAQGGTPNASIDTSAVAEAPVTAAAQGPGARAARRSRRCSRRPPPSNAPAAKAETPPLRPPAAATIQLGAFPSGAAAEKAWKALSGRFAYLAPLSHSVVQARSTARPITACAPAAPAPPESAGA